MTLDELVLEHSPIILAGEGWLITVKGIYLRLWKCHYHNNRFSMYPMSGSWEEINVKSFDIVPDALIYQRADSLIEMAKDFARQEGLVLNHSPIY